MNELELIIDLHIEKNRQGPGSTKETLRALELIGISDDKKLKIADIGCGTGSQTIVLAENTNSEIIAIDLFPEFLNELNRRAKTKGLSDKISTLEKSMEELPFKKEQFDIIWSEGAIYIMGFEKGVRDWKKYLKPGGFMVLSEINWTTNSRPKDLENFWTNEYSEMDTASNKIRVIEENGFTLKGYFTLDEKSWLVNYYEPIEKTFDIYLTRHNQSDIAIGIVNEYKKEIELYKKYKAYYNYGFYIAQKDKL